MATYVWVILCLLVLALTKYLTSVWLKGLQSRTRQTNQTILELKERVGQKQKSVDELAQSNERLRAKEAVLSHIVSNLETILKRAGTTPPPPPATDPPKADS